MNSTKKNIFQNIPPNTTPEPEQTDTDFREYADNYTANSSTSLNDVRPDIGTRDMNNSSYNTSEDFNQPVLNRASYNRSHLINDDDLDLDEDF